MKTFKIFVREYWNDSFGDKTGKSVQVKTKGHEHFGKKGTCRRMQGADCAVEFPGSKDLHWIHAGHLAS